MRLTDLSLRQTPFQEKGQRRIYDDALPGFGVTVGTRSKSFFIMYGADRRLRTIGKWPALSLKDARAEAKRLLASPPSNTGTMPLKDASAAWLEDAQSRLRPATVERYRYALKHVSGATVAAAATQSNDPHVIAALKAFLNWCVEQNITDRNPYANRKVSYAQRDRVLSDDEIVKLWHYDHPPYSTIVKALILTGQRRAQFANFRPDWIIADEIHFPASSMKGKRPHVLPITPLIAEVLPNLKPYAGWSKAKTRIDKHTEVTDWVLHDIRRYFSTTMARLTVPLHITEQILDHRSTVSGVAAIYNRYSFLSEMRDALRTYEQHLSSTVLRQVKP